MLQLVASPRLAPPNAGSWSRLSVLAAVLVVASLGASREAAASVVTLGVNGGPGLDQGELCLTTNACPGNPVFALASPAGVSGFFAYDNVAGKVSFSLTLTANANFGGETLLAGSTVSGSNVQVLASPLGPGQQITQIGSPINGSASLLFSPALSAVQSTPVITGLSCTLGFSSNVCGVSLGSTGLVVGPGASGSNYSGFLTFNVTATPVPVPAALPLLLSGMGAIGAFVRRRRSLALA